MIIAATAAMVVMAAMKKVGAALLPVALVGMIGRGKATAKGSGVLLWLQASLRGRTLDHQRLSHPLRKALLLGVQGPPAT